MATARRIERLNKVLAQHVAQILQHDFRLESGILITITHIQIAPNLTTAEAFFTALPESENEAAKKFLDKNIYEIQQALNKKLQIRPVPKLIFKIDKGQESAEQVYRLLEQGKRSRKKP